MAAVAVETKSAKDFSSFNDSTIDLTKLSPISCGSVEASDSSFGERQHMITEEDVERTRAHHGASPQLVSVLEKASKQPGITCEMRKEYLEELYELRQPSNL